MARHRLIRARSSISFCLVAALVLTACRSKKAGDEPSAEPATTGGLEAETSSGDSLASLGMMSSLLSGSIDKPGPYDERETSTDFEPDSPHIAVVEISGPLLEVRGFSWLGGMEGTELRRLVDQLAGLAADEQVRGIVLRFADLGPSPAHAEELRAELLALRTKRPSLELRCFAESASTFTYLIMTACTKIGLPPGGQLAIAGVAAVPMHLKGLLDKLGIKADFLHIGDYKGAAEPLTLDAPSKQSKETTAMILDEAFATLVSGIASGRSIEPDTARALIDQAIFTSDAARSAGLIDEVAPFDGFRGPGPWRRAKLESDGNPTQKLLRLIGLAPTPRPRGARIALIYAVGNVVDGGGGIGAARTEISSRTLVAALTALEADDDVKAIVLRVSSPGGSALASELIWAQLGELEKKKPVIVSMGPVAASGGYYISAGATHIFAQRNTLTGSIGVVGGKLATAGGLAKLGIKTFPVGRGKNALVFASPEPWSASERALIRSSMQAVYDQFASRVRAGRGDIADELMQGRVWTGTAALEHKLVDEIGGLSAAVAFARTKVGLDADSPIEVYPPEPTIKDLLGGFGVSSGVRSSALVALVSEIDPRLHRVVLSTMALVRGFERAPVQAAMFMPFIWAQ